MQLNINNWYWNCPVEYTLDLYNPTVHVQVHVHVRVQVHVCVHAWCIRAWCCPWSVSMSMSMPCPCPRCCHRLRCEFITRKFMRAIWKDSSIMNTALSLDSLGSFRHRWVSTPCYIYHLRVTTPRGIHRWELRLSVYSSLWSCLGHLEVVILVFKSILQSSKGPSFSKKAVSYLETAVSYFDIF